MQMQTVTQEAIIGKAAFRILNSTIAAQKTGTTFPVQGSGEQFVSVGLPMIGIGTNPGGASEGDRQILPSRQPVDCLIRLPQLRNSLSRVRVLQRWTGRVETITKDSFVAQLFDSHDLTAAVEEAEIEREEVSPGDMALLAQGAVFYWAIGYRDSAGGQRERISSLRFARLPEPDREMHEQARRTAERLAALFDCDAPTPTPAS